MLIAAAAAAAPFARPAHAAAATTSITIDGTKSGKTFDGIGALSAGASSRLLFDYPEPERSQILDYLFKPGYGADLQILKVEVGGDTNSTDGAEPSAQHTATDANYDRGYEWWLIAQAKARNPNIKLYALAWGAPGWIGVDDPANPSPGQPYFWSTDMITYYVDWLQHAKSDHGLTFDYIGGWNERGYSKTWYEKFHAALAAAKLTPKVVASDDAGWGAADDMAADPTFAASVDVLGSHYPCGYLSEMNGCSTTANATNSGKPLWASENGSEDIDAGAPVAKAINRGYLDAGMTAYINWPPIASIYPGLPWDRTGLMLANEPWSGNYQIGSALWATAQTTQFTAPGWHYIDSASGYLGGTAVNGDPHSGSYVTLASPDGTDYSTVYETLDSAAAQTVTVNVAGGLSAGTVHVWSSDFASGQYMVQQADTTPSSGSYTLTLQPGRIYSLTTTNGQGHGTAIGSARATLALPYNDSFDNHGVGQEARYLSDMQGAFETAACAGGRAGVCLQQMTTTRPIEWNSDSEPYALLGDNSWTNYAMAVDAYFAQTGGAELIVRGSAQGAVANTSGYYLVVNSDGSWSIVRNNAASSRTTLLNGKAAKAPGVGSWHRLALTVNGSTLTASLDGTTLGTVSDSSYSAGLAGLGTTGYQSVQFDNLSITAQGSDYGQNWAPIANANSGKDLEVPAGNAADGVGVDQWTDTGAAWEQWALVADGSGYVKVVNRNSGKLLEDPGSSGTAGTQLDQAADNGGTNQQWQAVPNPDGTLKLLNRAGGLIADVSSESTANGATVIQWTDHGGANQHWGSAVIPGRVYAIVSQASGLAMEVPGGGTGDGVKVDQWAYNGSSWEQWRVVSAGGGYVKLVNVNSGKVLDDTGVSPNAGTQLEQYTDTGAANEQWKVVPASNGYVAIVNRSSGLEVTVSGPGAGNNAQVVQDNPTGTASLWSLTPQ